MARHLAFTDPSELGLIADIVHTYWFDVGDIKFDAEKSELTLRCRGELDNLGAERRWFGLVSTAKGRGRECFLRIHEVDTYTVKDTEKVRVYDLAHLKYDALSGNIRIATGIPLEMSVHVRKFHVEIEETDNLIEH